MKNNYKTFSFEFVIRKIELLNFVIANKTYAFVFAVFIHVILQFDNQLLIEKIFSTSKFERIYLFKTINFVFIQLHKIELKSFSFEKNSIKRFENFFDVQNIIKSFSIRFEKKSYVFLWQQHSIVFSNASRWTHN